MKLCNGWATLLEIAHQTNFEKAKFANKTLRLLELKAKHLTELSLKGRVVNITITPLEGGFFNKLYDITQCLVYKSVFFLN